MPHNKSYEEEVMERFNNHFFGTDRSPDVSVDKESIYAYAARKFLLAELSLQRERIREDIEVISLHHKVCDVPKKILALPSLSK